MINKVKKAVIDVFLTFRRNIFQHVDIAEVVIVFPQPPALSQAFLSAL